jgi:hypothetical protein
MTKPGEATVKGTGITVSKTGDSTNKGGMSISSAN